MSAKVSVFANGGIVASPADRWSFLRRLLPGEWVSLLQYQVGVVTVSPDAAAEILEKHHGSNRPLQKAAVNKITRALVDGTFVTNGETVVFDDAGLMRQGQHRMVSCRDSGIPFETFVVCNVSSKCWSTYDQHQSRSASQVLAAMGVKPAQEVAGGIRCLAHFVQHGVVQKSNVYLPVHAVLDWYRSHPEILGSGTVAMGYGKARSLFHGSSNLCCLHYVFSRVDKGLADQMFHSIATRSVPAGDEWSAVRLLAERLQQDAVGQRQMPDVEVTALTIKAWNSVRDNKPLQRLRWLSTEDYPHASGLAYADNKPVVTGGVSHV